MERFKAEDFEDYKVDELKNILRLRELKLTGAHPDLVKRLVEDINCDIDKSNQDAIFHTMGTLSKDLKFCIYSFVHENKAYIVTRDSLEKTTDVIYKEPPYTDVTIHEFDFERMDITNTWTSQLNYHKVLYWRNRVLFIHVSRSNQVTLSTFELKTNQWTTSFTHQVESELCVHHNTCVVHDNHLYFLCSRETIKLEEEEVRRREVVKSTIQSFDLIWKQWKVLPNFLFSEPMGEIGSMDDLYGFIYNSNWYFLSKSCFITCTFSFSKSEFFQRMTPNRQDEVRLAEFGTVYLRGNTLFISGGCHRKMSNPAATISNLVIILNIDNDVITTENIGIPAFHHCMIEKDANHCYFLGGFGWTKQERCLFSPIRSIGLYAFPQEFDLYYFYKNSIFTDYKIKLKQFKKSDQKVFLVHKCIASQCPKLFEIKELEISPATCEAFIQWLYGREIDDKIQISSLKKLGIVLESEPLVSYCRSFDSGEIPHHNRRLERLYKNLYDTEEYHDVILTPCDNKIRYKSHKIILSLHSEYFYKMFSGSFVEAKPNAKVHFDNVDSSTLHHILRYIYKKKLDLPEDFDAAIALLKASHFVSVQKLDARVLRTINSFLNRDNVFDILNKVTDQDVDTSQIRSACLKYIEENFEKKELIDLYLEVRSALPMEEQKVSLYKRKRKTSNKPRKKIN